MSNYIIKGNPILTWVRLEGPENKVDASRNLFGYYIRKGIVQKLD